MTGDKVIWYIRQRNVVTGATRWLLDGDGSMRFWRDELEAQTAALLLCQCSSGWYSWPVEIDLDVEVVA